MHGRLRVKTTAQQEAEKAAEREKKLAKYNAGTQLLFKKRQEAVRDEETALQLSQILAVNPDFYTLWNYRREIFLHWKEHKDAEYLQNMLKSDLQFTEQCLGVNPKSYCAWHHRGWVMEHMPLPDWEAEVTLCDRYLQMDGRNFHCWDYRRLAAAAAGRQPLQELAATDRLISSNFSNYSSWHYRSQLLSQLYPPGEAATPIREDKYHQELELVQSAAFTDPDDQAAWFYHRWLLQGRQPADALVTCVLLSGRETARVVVSLAQAARPEDLELTLVAGEQKLQKWTSPAGERFDSVWICDVPADAAGGPLAVELNSADGRTRSPVTMATDPAAAAFTSDVSAATGEILKQELENIWQLGEMEPDNKWVLLSSVVMMWALDPDSHEQKILTAISRLTELDSLREGYYRDLRSRFIIEREIESCRRRGIAHLDLSGRQLTALYHTKHMVAMTTIDVSSNQLSSLDVSHLVAATEVDAAHNQLRRVCLPSGELSSLRVITLDNNDIRSVDDVECVGAACVETLGLRGNPVCDQEGFRSAILEKFPALRQLDGEKL